MFHSYQIRKQKEIPVIMRHWNQLMWWESISYASQQKCSGYKSAPSLQPQLKSWCVWRRRRRRRTRRRLSAVVMTTPPVPRAIRAHDPCSSGRATPGPRITTATGSVQWILFWGDAYSFVHQLTDLNVSRWYTKWWHGSPHAKLRTMPEVIGVAEV